MKKFFYVLMAAAALVAVSCDKEGTNGGENGGNEDAATKKVLTAIASKVDEYGNFVKGWKFNYHEDGKVAEMIEQKEDGSVDWNLKYSWNGTTVTVNEVWEGENGPEEGLYCTYTVGANGYFTECVKGSTTYWYEYDEEGHLTKIYEDWGEGKTVVSIVTWEDGNMTSWSKEGESKVDENNPGTEEEPNKITPVKHQTYQTDLNVAGIFTAYPEKGNIKKWMMNLGMFGKPSKNLVDTDKWNYYTSANTAEFEYRTDDDEFVVAEIKFWAGALDDETYFLWETAE